MNSLGFGINALGSAAHGGASLLLSYKASNSINVSVTTVNGETTPLLWGDGEIAELISGELTSKTGVPTGAGNAIFGNKSLIREWYSNLGAWNFALSGLPAGLTHYYNSGQNTTSGDLADLPAGLTYYANYGQNTTSGDLADLPAGLTYYANSGQNTTSGDLADLPAGLTYYANYGQNTTSGDLADLPAGLTYYANTGQNTTSGDLAGLPAGLTHYYNSGQNTTSGDLADLPAGLTYYANTGQNTVSAYTGKVWPNTMQRVYSVPISGLSSADVDQLLIDLSAVPAWTSNKEIYLKGANAAPTSAANAAIATLASKGVTVTTN